MDKFKPFRKPSKSSKIIFYAPSQPENAEAFLDYLNRMVIDSPYILSRPEDITQDVELQRERIQSRIGPGGFAINAWYENEIIGHLNFWSRHDRSRARHQGEFGITIDRRFRGEGIGRVLISSLIDWAKQDDNPIRKICLGVASENHGARKLYESLGFREEGYLKDQFLLDSGRYVDEIRCALFV